MEANTPAKVPRWITVILIVLFILSDVGLNLGNLIGKPPLWEVIANTLILAVPTGMLYFSIWVLIMAYQQHRRQGFISGRPAGFIYWTPRIAGVVLVLFVTLFSFDVFEGDASIWAKLGAFVMHSLPAIGLAIAVALAWRRDWVGFALFSAAALFFLVITWQGLRENPVMEIGVLMIFSIPMALIAAMYYANWKWRTAR